MTKHPLALTLCAGAILTSGCGGKDSGGEEGGSSACADDVAAFNACYDERGADTSADYSRDDFCEYFTDSSSDATFECKLAAVNAADCSTVEGIVALYSAGLDCSDS